MAGAIKVTIAILGCPNARITLFAIIAQAKAGLEKKKAEADKKAKEAEEAAKLAEEAAEAQRIADEATKKAEEAKKKINATHTITLKWRELQLGSWKSQTSSDRTVHISGSRIKFKAKCMHTVYFFSLLYA